MHSLFAEYLKQFELDSKFKNILKKQLALTLNSLNQEGDAEQKLLQRRLKTVESKIESLDEKFIENKINSETYQKFKQKFEKELTEIHQQTKKGDFQYRTKKN